MPKTNTAKAHSAAVNHDTKSIDVPVGKLSIEVRRWKARQCLPKTEVPDISKLRSARHSQCPSNHITSSHPVTVTMPPRIPSSRISQPQTCQCCLTRTTSEPVVAARQFHASARHDTRLRRNMWEWLKGPGKVFRDPLPGSTNYLSAYDKSGNLLRARRNQSKDDQSRDELDEDEDTIVQRELDQGLDDVEREDRALSRATRRAEREEADARGGIPPERLGDMRPYPLNQSFRSQPVLSEELREQLYIQVVNYKHDIPSVAATFGVDVRRVAAVIRLKTIEKQWEEEVSTHSLLFLFIPPRSTLACYDDLKKKKKIRLVLKTPTWLEHICH